MRAAGREVSLNHQLQGNEPAPDEAAERAESRARIQQALADLGEHDRGVLALRHFEQLSNPEVAQLLEISPAAARKRYFRALKRLKDVLGHLPDGRGDDRP
jgi:RNA polymerase sigma-70 factor (ECF subfamily)